jgi:hypothetical protein
MGEESPLARGIFSDDGNRRPMITPAVLEGYEIASVGPVPVRESVRVAAVVDPDQPRTTAIGSMPSSAGRSKPHTCA